MNRKHLSSRGPASTVSGGLKDVRSGLISPGRSSAHRCQNCPLRHLNKLTWCLVLALCANAQTPTTGVPGLPTSTVNSCPGAPQSSYVLTAASGWRVMPLLGRLSSPRGIAMDTKGNLFVSERNKGLTGHTLNADGCVTSSKTVVADTGPNHGIDFSPAGDKLYARYAPT